jgi:hypothetical protein
MRLPLDRVLMDPTTGALGYGLEYTYSVMERLRLAALTGDGMTQQPMICFVGEESWRQKEARACRGRAGRMGRHREAGHHLGDSDRYGTAGIGRRYRGAAPPQDHHVVRETIAKLMAD